MGSIEEIYIVVNMSNDIIVLSHLRWEFVTQRPQHIMNRFARDRRILFVEEPIFIENSLDEAKIIQVNKKITILQPILDGENWEYNLLPIIEKYTKKLKFDINPLLWFYSSHFLPILEIKHSLVVYDCMDELSAFKSAHPDLIYKEEKLIKNADIVFTGGKSLYESKKKIADHIYCFPSSVDRKHFEKTFKSKTRIPLDIRKLTKPIVGYYGVIDERIDMPLLLNIAKKLPEVSFVMIGPVVKISEEELAKNKNIYYLGSKDYKKLPNYLKAFDVAMMPFAMNASTKFISPTKTLEYMAAHKPIVSTPIFDVVRDYSEEVRIAYSADQFIDGINLFLHETKKDKLLRIKRETKIINKTSWDNTVKLMKKHIEAELKRRNKELTRKLKVNLNLGKIAYE